MPLSLASRWGLPLVLSTDEGRDPVRVTSSSSSSSDQSLARGACEVSMYGGIVADSVQALAWQSASARRITK